MGFHKFHFRGAVLALLFTGRTSDMAILRLQATEALIWERQVIRRHGIYNICTKYSFTHYKVSYFHGRFALFHSHPPPPPIVANAVSKLSSCLSLLVLFHGLAVAEN